jgi:hypothetical protein
VETTHLKQVNSDVLRQEGTAFLPRRNDLSPATAGGPDLRHRQRRGVTAAVRSLWAGWKRVARTIGDFQARALMTVFYFLILGPLAMVLRWRSDPLAIKARTARGWRDIEGKDGVSMDRARRQF